MRDDDLRRALTDANPWWRAPSHGTDPVAWVSAHRLLMDRSKHDLGYRAAVLDDIAAMPRIDDRLVVLTGPRRVGKSVALLDVAAALCARSDIDPRQIIHLPCDGFATRDLRRVLTIGPETWTADELRTFLGCASPHRLYPALHLAATTGMRRGELAGLHWGDWNSTNHRLSITRSRQALHGRATEFATKTRTSRRSIDLDPGTEQLLNEWKRNQQREGNPTGTRDPIFTNPPGGALHPETISQLFAQIIRRSGLPPIRFHDLRHTHASLLVANGVPIKVVSERLGHTHPSFTIHTYQHLLPGMGATAARQFANLIAR